jgi:hypothetical protein
MILRLSVATIVIVSVASPAWANDLSLDYQTTAVAKAHSETESNQATNAPASAHAEWSDDVWHGDDLYHLWETTDSQIQVQSLNASSLQTSSTIDCDTYNPLIFGQYQYGETTLGGTLLLGTSASFPAGSMLTLAAEATGSFPVAPFESDFSVKVYRGSTLIGELDTDTGSTTLDVFAGEQLTLETSHWCSIVEEGFSRSSNLDLTLTLIPEPATGLALALGGFAAMRRRRR